MSTPASPPAYVLDTSVLVHAVRQDRVWARIRARFQLLLAEPTPIVSVVTVGELHSLARSRAGGDRKRDQLDFFLATFRVVTIHDPDVIANYAHIDSHFQLLGRPMGKNDVWIAATTAALAGHLLTCDRDFDPLDPLFLTRSWIDPT